MKTYALKSLIAAALLATGYVAHESDRLPKVLPAQEPPQPARVLVRGPTDGLVGRDYFFALEASGDHGRPTWIVSPACDVTASQDGLSCRIRCDDPGLYSITVAMADRSANVAAEVAFFQAIDVDAEINQAVAQATTVTEPPPPTLGQVVAALPSFQALDHDQRVTAASQFALMSQRLQAGLVPSDSDPLKLLQGTLGESYRSFIDEVSSVVDELKLSGQVTTAASYAPVCSEVAAALGELP